jgi:hypothetical protein
MSADMSVNNNAGIQPANRVLRQALSCPKAFIKRLIARKPMGTLQTEIETRNELRRTLNWVQLTAIGLGGTIGE